jgi:hypothetical protein
VDPVLNAPACLVLAADMVAPASAGRWAAVRLVVAALTRGLLDLTEPGGPAVPGHLIISRRGTGTELLRMETDTFDAGFLAYVRSQLDELTVGEFLDQWGIDPDLLDEGRGR